MFSKVLEDRAAVDLELGGQILDAGAPFVGLDQVGFPRMELRLGGTRRVVRETSSGGPEGTLSRTF